MTSPKAPMRLATALLAAAAFCAPALAHDGHGLFGAHWHSTDTLGFVGVVVAIAVALWWSGGKR
jgi:Co/Zn/Cd efflux system component